jgi:hypothetical protein
MLFPVGEGEGQSAGRILAVAHASAVDDKVKLQIDRGEQIGTLPTLDQCMSGFRKLKTVFGD